MSRPALVRLALLALTAVIASCAEQPAQNDAPVERSSYERIASDVFARSCALSGCHSGAIPTGELSLESAKAYDALVGVAAVNDAARGEGLVRVVPGKPATSFLVRKLTGSILPEHGARMPLGSSALHASEIEFIRQWITAGAPRTGSVADTSLLAHRHGGQDEFVPLAPPSHGFQLHMAPFNVRPHGEREVFYATATPVQWTTYMTGVRVLMRNNSHHFTLYTIPPGGAALPMEVIRDRGPNNDEFLRTRGFLFGSQEADVSYSLPAGVGVAINPEDRMDLNVHSVNPSDDTVLGEAYVNVFTADHVDRVATPLLWSFDKFVIPAHEERTLYDTMAITEPMDLLMLTSHFHKHGKEFRIYVLRDGGSELAYASYQWDHPVIERYDVPIHLGAGDRLRIEATYFNDTNLDIFYGPKSTDEMCAIFGLVVRGM